MSRETIAGSDKDKIVYFSPPRLSIFDSARKRYEETKNKPLRKFYFRDIDEDLDIAASAVPRKSRSPLKDIQNANSDNHNIFHSENTNGALTIDTKKRQNVLSKNNYGNESPVNEIKKSKISAKKKNENQNDFKKFENFNMPPPEAVQVASPRPRRSPSGSAAKLFPDVLLDDASLGQSSLSPRRMSLRSFKQKQSSEESCQSSDVAQIPVNLNLPSCSRVTLRTKYRKKDETNTANDSEMPLSKIEIQKPDIPSSNIETSTLASVVTSGISESDEENNLVSAFNSTFTTIPSVEEEQDNDRTIMNSTFVVPETDVTDIASGTQATNTISDSQSAGIAASYIESLDSSLLRSSTISLPTSSETMSTCNSYEYEFTSQVSDGLTSMTSDQGGTSQSNVYTVDDKTYVLSGQSSVPISSKMSTSTWSSLSSGNSTFLVDSVLSANSMTWDMNETNATTQIHRDRVIVPDSDLNISGVSWLGASKNTNSEVSMSPRSAFSSSAVAAVAKATDFAASKSNGSKVTDFATSKSNGSAVSKGAKSGLLYTAMQGPCHNVASSPAQTNKQTVVDGAVNEVTSTVQSLTKSSRIPVPIKSDKKKSEQKSKIPILCGSNLIKNSPIGFGSGAKQVVAKTTQTNFNVIPRQKLNFRFTGNQPRPEVIKFTGGAASPSTRVQRVIAKPTTMAAVASQQTTRTGDARAARREEARAVAFKTAPRTAKSYKDMVRTNKTHELLMAKRNIK